MERRRVRVRSWVERWGGWMSVEVVVGRVGGGSVGESAEEGGVDRFCIDAKGLYVLLEWIELA